MIPLRDANPTRRFPVVTIALIVLCVIVFAYELGVQATAGDAGLERLFDQWALVPGRLAAAVIVIGFWFLLQLIDGLASRGVSHTSGGVALFEHIGGFLAGVVVGLLVRGLGGGRSTRAVGSADEFRVG